MKSEDEGLQKHTLNLFEGDYEKLRMLFPDIGAGAIVRRIVRRFLEQVESNGGSIDAKVEIKL